MKFNSIDYVLLLTCTLILFFALRPRGRTLLLLAASVIFYAFWSIPLVSLMFISAGVDFAAGRLLERTGIAWKRRIYLLTSIVVNLGLLGYFKYSNFFLENIYAALGDIREVRYLTVLLPPGISFYTFQTMSYTIDVYRKKTSAAKSFWRFAVYVMFFPQLVAGPIERASHLLTQLDYSTVYRGSASNFISGSRLILWGMFKKVVIADHCALIADQVYAQPENFGGWSSLIATLAFSLQIYCDFSAYSDIARGSARLFGVDLMKNFNLPYLATSAANFWRRWHISLSTWIRDYIYVPLGGSRVGKTRLVFNVVVTMFLSGLWHGAAWNFVLWGLFHGALLGIHAMVSRTKAWSQWRMISGPAGIVLSWAITQICVLVGWILFRINDMPDFAEICRNIGHTIVDMTPPSPTQTIFLLFFAFFLAASFLSRKWLIMERIDEDPALGVAFYGSLTVLMLVLAVPDGPQFIYFQF